MTQFLEKDIEICSEFRYGGESFPIYQRILSRDEAENSIVARISTRAKVLLLDEPTAGLDITSARTVFSCRTDKRRRRYCCALHINCLTQQVCDRIIIIHNGNVMADGSPEQLIIDNDCESLEEAYGIDSRKSES